MVASTEQPELIGRKGYISTQNVMNVCDSDMCFIFALKEWEGTAHDAYVFENALTTSTSKYVSCTYNLFIIALKLQYA